MSDDDAERKRIARKKWNLENRDKVLAQRKRWREKHKQERLEYQKKYRLENPENRKKWDEKYKEKTRGKTKHKIADEERLAREKSSLKKWRNFKKRNVEKL